MIQDKAQPAGNGMPFTRAAPKVGALGDAGLDHLGSSLRASREAVARRVAPLDKDWAIARETRLAINCFSIR